MRRAAGRDRNQAGLPERPRHCSFALNHPKRMNALTRMLALTLLVAALAGCSTDDSFFLTQRLWEEGRFRTFHEPAPQSHVQVYRSENPADYLITYDEMREKDGRVRLRAFYLSAARRHAPPGRRPKFSNPGRAEKLRPVPIRDEAAGTADLPAGTSCWVESSNGGTSWRIREAGGVVGEFALPVYPARGATALQVALTPLALTGDAVIVGSILALFVATAYAQGHSH